MSRKRKLQLVNLDPEDEEVELSSKLDRELTKTKQALTISQQQVEDLQKQLSSYQNQMMQMNKLLEKYQSSAYSKENVIIEKINNIEKKLNLQLEFLKRSTTKQINSEGFSRDIFSISRPTPVRSPLLIPPPPHYYQKF